jgi:hypothetical protein
MSPQRLAPLTPSAAYGPTTVHTSPNGLTALYTPFAVVCPVNEFTSETTVWPPVHVTVTTAPGRAAAGITPTRTTNIAAPRMPPAIRFMRTPFSRAVRLKRCDARTMGACGNHWNPYV